MREIIFRGKSLKTGNWCIGVPFFTGDEKYGKNYYIGNDFSECGEYGCVGCEGVEVDAETIGQYTGLKDVNGHSIFEGDIVKYGDTVHEVVFEQRNGTAYFGIVYSKIETLPFGHYQDLRQIKVIGNIHDNQELLRGV